MPRHHDLGGKPDCRILILGGGFGGIYTALALEKDLRPEDRTEVVLVNAENFFLFTPLLCEVASSSIETSHAINPIRRLFKRTRFVEGEAVGLDLDGRSVLVRHSDGHDYSYDYDHLVVALGARTGYFGMHDVEEHALTVKTLGDAINVRNWAIQMLENADVEKDPGVRSRMLTFVVAGGGFTGVEVAGEVNNLVRDALDSYPTITQRDVRIVIVEAKSRLLPEFDEKLAQFATNKLKALGVEVMLNTMVNGASAEDVHLKGKDPIATRTLVWTTGVAPQPFIANSDIPKDEKGWITADAHFRVAGRPGVWSLGDCARIPDVLRPGHYQPALAQHAIREARQLSRNIVASIRGEPTHPFRYKSLGQMATLGHRTGIGTLGPAPLSIPVSGLPAWLIWRTYYLLRLPRIEKRLRVAVDWTADMLFGRDISQIQTYTTNSNGGREIERRHMPSPAPSNGASKSAGKSG